MNADQNPTVSIPRLVIAGLSSGVGKTSIVVGLAQALRQRGLSVALFKCGPDYLDPSYHQRALGRTSYNLDGWMMGPSAVQSTFIQHAKGHDIAIIEGVMGLFDGASSRSEQGSTAELAKWLSAPVVTVCDASGMARTIAAVAYGLQHFDPKLNMVGMIANRVGSVRHSELLAEALGTMGYFGGLRREPELTFPERHLGLQTARGDLNIDQQISSWSEKVSRELAIDRLLEHARNAPPLSLSPVKKPRSYPPSRCTLAIAKDDAFHFYYESNLQQLRDHGAEIVEFSPMFDQQLPPCHGLIFGGGYPELYAETLARNESMKQSIRDFAQHHPVYAECGGLMYLGQSIHDLKGATFSMTGLLPGQAILCDRIQALGYVEVETACDTFLGPRGTKFRGHQFRYSKWEWTDDSGSTEKTSYPDKHHAPDLLTKVPPEILMGYKLTLRRSSSTVQEGYFNGKVLASYVHAHWATSPEIPKAFVEACALTPK